MGSKHFSSSAYAKLKATRCRWATFTGLHSFLQANTTTWVSINAPEALLYACLIQAYSYTKGPPEMLQYFENSYKQAVGGVGVEQTGRRRRDEYRDGMIRVPIKSASPGP
jgi:hypothetical protein